MAGRNRQPLAFTTNDALRREYKYIWREKASDGDLNSYYTAALAKNQAALCLSGGGIRSAAFALGVLEALAKKGLLTKFHYLSTVSGGGYVGGFLTRWIYEKAGDADSVQNVLAEAATAGKAEPAPLQWLREYSNFLTPRTGLTSADTWSAAILWIRNTLINWFVFTPFFVLAVAIPHLYLQILQDMIPAVAGILLLVGIALIAFATCATCTELPSYVTQTSAERVFWLVAVPSLLASFVLAAALAPALLGGLSFDLGRLGAFDAPATGGAAMSIGLLLGYLLGWLAVRQPGFWRNLHIWTVGAAVSGAAVAVGAYLVATPYCSVEAKALLCGWQRPLYASLAPVGIVIAQLLLTIFYTALRRVPSEAIPESNGGDPMVLRADNPKFSPDLDREWLARLSAEKLRFAVAGGIFFALVLIGPLLFFNFRPQLEAWLVSIIGGASGLTAVLGGKAASTGGTTPAGWKKALTRNRIVLIATVIFIALLTIFFSWGEAALAGFLAPFASKIASALGAPHFTDLYGHLAVILLAGVLLWIASRRVNVNTFSLNAVYRNRLGRAFLGAARTRNTDPFTNFDPGDNVRMSELAYEPPLLDEKQTRVLFPVVNLAINLVRSDKLAWQERKASSFTVTPLACGSAILGPEEGMHAAGAYVETVKYAGSEQDGRMPGNTGISLATAMAISGAAASPQMGYNSSAATAFLMTLFNVRLGAWLPNPGRHSKKSICVSKPSNALRPFLSELTGGTHDKSKNIYLSDGGHFENLGIYEMVRRRCRYIFVSDAGCDPNAKLEDLGNAIRKVMADIEGVEITFRELKLRSRKEQSEQPFTFAYGEINYGKGTAGKQEIGYLLYVKPSYFTTKPPAFENELAVDIRAYANLNEDFPHESTGDQWFSESQFESYRRLGEILVYEIGRGKSYEGERGLSGFFDDVRIAATKKPEAPRSLPRGTFARMAMLKRAVKSRR